MPDADARLTARVRRAGAVIMGKTNVPPNAGNWQSWNPIFGRTNNPWDPDRTPGGSTGGGTAALAAGLTPLEFGSDVGGSIRVPAAFCGVYGHRPSETAIPRSGHFPGSPIPNPVAMMSVQGPLARSGQDLSLAFGVLAGPEVGKDAAWRLEVPSLRLERLSGYRVAVLPSIGWLPVDDEITGALEDLAGRLTGTGARVAIAQPEMFGDLRAHHEPYSRLLSLMTSVSDSGEERRRFAEDERVSDYEFGESTARGLEASAADLIIWLGQREEFRQSYRDFFGQWDVLLAPITIVPAFPHTDAPFPDRRVDVNGQQVHYYFRLVYPAIATLCSQPATAFPVEMHSSGLPIGLQPIGPYLEDRTSIQFAGLVEQGFGGFAQPPTTAWGRLRNGLGNRCPRCGLTHPCPQPYPSWSRFAQACFQHCRLASIWRLWFVVDRRVMRLLHSKLPGGVPIARQVLPPRIGGRIGQIRKAILAISPGVVDSIELMYETGWSDGLPVVPPTRERVKQFTDYLLPRSPDELVADVPPLGGRATVERVAVNAVMAGCLPEYMPVVTAAIQALVDDRFNLRGVQCSTGIHSPLVIINGPMARDLEVNSGYNCFGQGWRANATIGRAVKLVLVNLGGAVPGQINKSTFGHPGSYTYCIAEAEESSPWEPMHVEMGFASTDSTVAVFPGEAPHNIMYHAGNPRDFLTVLADSMCTLGNVQMYVMGSTLVVLGPEHARTLADGGWRKRDIQAFLFEHARKPVAALRRGGPPQGDSNRGFLWPKFIDPSDDSQLVPVVRRPEDIHIMVAGGAGGPHSAYVPGWGSRLVIRKIQVP